MNDVDPGAQRAVTVGQEALWWVNRIDPDSAAYNLAVAVRVRTPLRPELLRRALTAVATRHDTLRSVFVEADGRCRRRVLAPESVELECLDAPADEEIAEFVHRVTTEPFRLDQRVLRAMLIRPFAADGTAAADDLAEADELVLVLAAHHIAVDGYSLGIVLRDLLEAYGEFAQDRAPNWPAPTQDWDAHVAREQEALAPEGRAELEAYWQAVCAGAPTVLDLPRSRRGAGHATTPLTVDQDTTAELPRAAGKFDVSTVDLMVAAYQALLHRYTAQDDFLIALPVRTRVGALMRGVAGYFANPIALRARFTESTTLLETAREAHRQIIDGQAHAAYPFAQLPRLLGVRPEPGRPVLAQAGFSFIARIKRGSISDLLAAGEAGGLEIEFGGLRLRAFDVRQQEGQFDLMLELQRGGDTLRGSLRHSAAVFAPREAHRFAARYNRLLRAAWTQPDTPIGELDLDAADGDAGAADATLLGADGFARTPAQPVAVAG